MAKTRGTLKFYDMNSPEIEATTAGQQTEYKGRKGRGTLTFTEIEPIPSTGNAGRDRWNALKKTIDIRSTAPQRTKQEGSYGAEKGFFDRLGLTVSGGAKGSLAGNMDAMGAAYEAGQGGRTKRDTAELKDAQWAVARAKHDYDADPSEVNKSALGIATTKMKAFADVLGEGAYEQALEAAYDAAAQFDTGDLKALYNLSLIHI